MKLLDSQRKRYLEAVQSKYSLSDLNLFIKVPAAIMAFFRFLPSVDSLDQLLLVKSCGKLTQIVSSKFSQNTAIPEYFYVPNGYLASFKTELQHFQFLKSSIDPSQDTKSTPFVCQFPDNAYDFKKESQKLEQMKTCGRVANLLQQQSAVPKRRLFSEHYYRQHLNISTQKPRNLQTFDVFLPKCATQSFALLENQKLIVSQPHIYQAFKRQQVVEIEIDRFAKCGFTFGNHCKVSKNSVKDGQSALKQFHQVSKLDHQQKQSNPFGDESAEMTFVEAGTQLLFQLRKLLSYILELKQIKYLYISDDFKIRETHTLTTKQQKKSRIGASILICLEYCQLIYRLILNYQLLIKGQIGKVACQNNIRYELSNLSWFSGFYRYKYNSIKSIQMIKDIRLQQFPVCVLHFNRINIDPMINKFSFQPYQKVVYDLTRGLYQTMNRYNRNFVERMLQIKHVDHDKLKTVSGQRKLAFNDLIFQKQLLKDLIQQYELNDADKTTVYNLSQHIQLAWKQYRQQLVPYQSPLIPSDIQNTINQNVANYYEILISDTLKIRQQIYYGNKRLTKLQIRTNFHRFSQYIVANLPKLDRICYDLVKTDENYRAFLKKLLNSALEMKTNNLKLFSQDSLQIDLKQSFQRILALNQSRGEISESPEFEEFFENLSKNLDYTTNIEVFDKFSGLNFEIVEQNEQLNLVYEEIITDYLLHQLDCTLMRFNKTENLPFYCQSQQFAQDLVKICAQSEKLEAEKQLKAVLLTRNLLFIPFNVLERLLKIFVPLNIAEYVIRRLRRKFVHKNIEMRFCCLIFNKTPLFAFVLQFLTVLIEVGMFKSYEEYGDQCGQLAEVAEGVYYKSSGLHQCVIKVENGQQFQDDRGNHGVQDCVCFRKGIMDQIRGIEFISIDRFEIESYKLANTGNSGFQRKIFFDNFVITLQLSHQTLPFIIKPSLKALFELEQNILYSLIFAPLQFSQISQKFNSIINQFIFYFNKSLLVKDFMQVLLQFFSITRNKYIRFMQNQVNTFEKARFPDFIFDLPVELNGLGIYKQEVFRFITPLNGRKVSRLSNQQLQNDQFKNICQENFKFSIYFLIDEVQQTYKNLLNIDMYYQKIVLDKISLDQILKCSLFQSSQNICQKISFQDVLSSINQHQQQTVSQRKVTSAQQRGLSMIANKRFISYWSPIINKQIVFAGKQSQIQTTGIYIKGKLATLGKFYLQLFINNLWVKIHQQFVQQFYEKLKQSKMVSGILLLKNHQNKAFCDYQYNENAVISDIKLTIIGCSNITKAINLNNVTTLQFISQQQSQFDIYIDFQLFWPSADLFEEKQVLQQIDSVFQQHYLKSSQDPKVLRIIYDIVYQRIFVVGCLAELKQELESLPNMVNDLKSVQVYKSKLCSLLQVQKQNINQQDNLILQESNVQLIFQKPTAIVYVYDQISQQQPIKYFIILLITQNLLNIYLKQVKVSGSSSFKSKNLDQLIAENVKSIVEQHKIQQVFNIESKYVSIFREQIIKQNVNIYESSIEFGLDCLLTSLVKNQSGKVINEQIFAFYQQEFKRFGNLQEQFFRLAMILRSLELKIDVAEGLKTLKADYKEYVAGICKLLSLVQPSQNANQVLQQFDQQVKQKLINNYEQQFCCKLNNINNQQMRQLILGVQIKQEQAAVQELHLFNTVQNNQILSQKLLLQTDDQQEIPPVVALQVQIMRHHSKQLVQMLMSEENQATEVFEFVDFIAFQVGQILVIPRNIKLFLQKHGRVQNTFLHFFDINGQLLLKQISESRIVQGQTLALEVGVDVEIELKSDGQVVVEILVSGFSAMFNEQNNLQLEAVDDW